MYTTMAVPNKHFKLFGVDRADRKKRKFKNKFVKTILKEDYFFKDNLDSSR